MKKTFIIAVCIALLQLSLALAGQGKRVVNNPPYAYQKLALWDTGHYERIITEGYTSDTASFFPLYPMLAGKLLPFLPPAIALLVVAQLSCIGLWYFVVRTCKTLDLNAGPVIAMALAHPAAFYLVTGYSESLFLAMIIGFFYFTITKNRIGACVTGICSGMTRITAVAAVAALPVLKKQWWYLVFPILGVCLVFLHAHLFFGQWNTYLLLQKAGWEIRPDYFVIFDPPGWLFAPWKYGHPQYIDYTGSLVKNYTNEVSRWVSSVFIYLSIAGLIWGRRTFSLPAAAMLYIAIAGTMTNGLQSMIRYTLPVHILLCLAFSDRLQSKWFYLVPLTTLPYALVLIRNFTNGIWVA